MSDNINKVRERLSAAAELYAGLLHSPSMAPDLRALLADHARLQADADRYRKLFTSMLDDEDKCTCGMAHYAQCCDCGGNGCGCSGCFSCNACDHCRGEEE